MLVPRHRRYRVDGERLVAKRIFRVGEVNIEGPGLASDASVGVFFLEAVCRH